MRLCGRAKNSPIRSARSRSGIIKTWSSSARGAGPSASRRSRSPRSSPSGRSTGGPPCLLNDNLNGVLKDLALKARQALMEDGGATAETNAVDRPPLVRRVEGI